MYTNVIIPSKKGQQMKCWRCGRLMYQYTKNPNRIGCLNTKCRGYLWGAKKIDEKFLVPLKK